MYHAGRLRQGGRIGWRWRHKGDACLGFTPPKHCDASFVGDPLTGKAGGYRLWVMGNGDGAISALTANLLR